MQNIAKKTCGKCKNPLDSEFFHKSSREKDGLQAWCKSCRKGWKVDEKRVSDFNRYHNGKDKYRDGFYKRNYGITLKDYEILEKEQNGLCKICEKLCTTSRRLAVDHCHATMMVRGLLCSNCNKALGLFRDNPELLQNAITYLNKKYKE